MRELILYTIRTVSEYAIANEEEFRQRVLDASRIKQEAEAKGLKKKLAKAKKRYAELDVLINNLSKYRDAISQADEQMLVALLEEGKRRKEEVDG
jgi:flagellar biosynthesis/type III secretory pathway protein FliH